MYIWVTDKRYSTVRLNSDVSEQFYSAVFVLISVCIRFLNNLTKRMKESGVDSSSPDGVEIEIFKACRDAKGKDERFVSIMVWYIPVMSCMFNVLLDCGTS